MPWNERNALAEHFFGSELPSVLSFPDGGLAYAPESKIGQAFAAADALLASQWIQIHDDRVALEAQREF